MKIISYIIKKRIVRKIRVHLRLWDEPARQRPPPPGKAGGNNYPLKSNDLFYVPFDDGWPGYEE